MPFESLYLTSYLSSIDISPPNHTVLKIFDFKGLTLTINFVTDAGINNWALEFGPKTIIA